MGSEKKWLGALKKVGRKGARETKTETGEKEYRRGVGDKGGIRKGGQKAVGVQRRTGGGGVSRTF